MLIAMLNSNSATGGKTLGCKVTSTKYEGGIDVYDTDDTPCESVSIRKLYKIIRSKFEKNAILRKNTYKNMDKYKATQRDQTKRYRERHGAGRPRVPWTEEEYWRVLKHDISDA